MHAILGLVVVVWGAAWVGIKLGQLASKWDADERGE